MSPIANIKRKTTIAVEIFSHGSSTNKRLDNHLNPTPTRLCHNPVTFQNSRLIPSAISRYKFGPNRDRNPISLPL